MKSRKTLTAIVLVLLLIPSTLFAQKPLADWNNVVKLKSGTKIVVITRNGREVAGEKRVANDDMLFVEADFAVQGQRTINFSRDEIAEVRKRKNRWLLPLVSAAVGIGVGIAIGSTADHPGSDDPGLGKLVGGVMGGLIGGTAGGAAARFRKQTKAVYVAP
jgi:hypothetical protein